MKKNLTKIVVTLGPATEAPEKIEQLLEEGVTIFRFNLKHNTLSWHKKGIARVLRIAKRKGKSVGILVDLEGPEVRLEVKGRIKFKKGQALEVGKEVSFSYQEKLLGQLKNSTLVFVDDGLYSFEVRKRRGKVFLVAKGSGELEGRKSVGFDRWEPVLPSLSERDKEFLKNGVAREADFVALSFVQSGKDLRELREFLKKVETEAKVVAKIETKRALENLEEIIAESDGIMVARGDLGVATPLEEVPYWQKVIVEKARTQGRFVIVATQMLQSMIDNPVPTRAEVSDIANAVYDRADALMLSGETAQGRWPTRAVKIMRKTILFAEKSLREKGEAEFFLPEIADKRFLMVSASYNLYLSLLRSPWKKRLAGFLVLTETGRTAELLSLFRPHLPIIAVTPSPKVAETLHIWYGIESVSLRLKRSGPVSLQTLQEILERLKREGKIKEKSLLIVLHGDYWAKPGQTSTVRLLEA